MKFKHIISAKQFDTATLQGLFELTDKIKAGKFDHEVLKDKIMATLFYQPSTRTRLSFESAMIRLGGSVIGTENAAEFSSAVKGETLEDTIRIINFYSDLIVIRHPESGTAEVAAQYSKVPIINAGDGIGEHPTQGLLDLYTISRKVGLKNITVAICGDHAHYRPSHSLTYLLSLYKTIKIVYVSPKKLAIPNEVKNHLRKNNISYSETENFLEGVSKADVIYQGRIPKEYLGNDYKKYLGKYILDKEAMSVIAKNSIVMHPLPRVNEISQDVDSDPRAVYFEQAQNGFFIRTALLLYLFDKANF